MEGGAPKGRRLDGDGGMKKSEEMHLKQAINESTLSTATRSPFPNGEGYETRIPLSPKHSLSCVGKAKRRRLRRQKKKANPASLRSAAPSKGRGLRGYSLLPMEGGAPKGRRLDGDSGMKDKWGNASQAGDIREYPIHRCAVPLPQWGRLRYENNAILDTKPSPRGEGAPKGRMVKPLPQP